MIGRTYLERGQPVTVLARWNGKGPRNVLIERADGATLVTLALVAVAAARLGLLTVRLGPPAKPRTRKPKETTP